MYLNIKKYLDRIAYYLKDSYGFDKFSKYLYIAGLILSISRFTSPLGFVFIIYGTWRTFSKNKYKRYQELSTFENYLSKVKQKYYGIKSSALGYSQYKIFKCPNCAQKLRVPRKKGKVVISCKKCGTEFKGKS
jgi:hypothetical protein